MKPMLQALGQWAPAGGRDRRSAVVCCGGASVHLRNLLDNPRSKSCSSRQAPSRAAWLRANPPGLPRGLPIALCMACEHRSKR